MHLSCTHLGEENEIKHKGIKQIINYNYIPIQKSAWFYS